MGSDYEKSVRAKSKEATWELMAKASELGKEGLTKEKLAELRADFDKLAEEGGKLYMAHFGDLVEATDIAKEMGASAEELKDLADDLERNYWENIVPNEWSRVKRHAKTGAPSVSMSVSKVPGLNRAPFRDKEGNATPVGEFFTEIVRRKGVVKAPKGQKLTLFDINQSARKAEKTLSSAKKKATKKGGAVYDIPKGKKGKELRDALKIRNAISSAANAAKTFKNVGGELSYTGKGGLSSAAKAIRKKRKKQ